MVVIRLMNLLQVETNKSYSIVNSKGPITSPFTVYHISGVFFSVSQNLRKWGKSVTFLYCVSHVLRFEKFLIENDIGYYFCIFNYL